MYPKIYDSSDNLLAILDNITSNKLIKRINNKYIFDFTCFEKEYKSEYIQFDNVIQADNQTFDIKYIETSHNFDGEIVYSVKCEHVIYRLLDTELDNYAYTGTPTEILTDLLSGTDFSVGTVDYVDSVVFAVNRSTNKMAIIYALANSLGGEIGFSDDGFTINLLSSVGSDNGYQVRIKKNLQSIKKVVDQRGETKTTYQFDVVNISQSDELKRQGLEDLESVDIGDTIQLIDETLGIDISQSVLEIQKDVIKDRRTTIVTGNNWETLVDEVAYIADDVVTLNSKAIKNDETYYGVKINNAVGIEIERDDLLARTKLNADEFTMQKGDGLGAYTDSLYFDTTEEKWLFTGAVETEDLTVIGNMFFGDAGAATGIWFVGATPFNIIFQNSTDGALVLTGDVVIHGDLTVGGSIN